MRLPKSKMRVDYSDRMREHWPELGDARLVPIDLEVENTFDDYRSGRDRVLETILSRSP